MFQTVLCSKCNKPAQINRTLRNCKCKGAQYCNNKCYQSHWKEHKPEHNRLVKLLPSPGETKEEPKIQRKQLMKINPKKPKNLMIVVLVDRRRNTRSVVDRRGDKTNSVQNNIYIKFSICFNSIC